LLKRSMWVMFMEYSKNAFSICPYSTHLILEAFY
jgi:hypothetical protein